MYKKVALDGTFLRSHCDIDKEEWESHYAWLYQDVYSYNLYEDECKNAHYLRETIKLFLKWGHTWEFKEVIPPPAREKKISKRKTRVLNLPNILS